MKQKIIYLITGFLFLLEIIFSFYYSSVIVNENRILTDSQKKLDQLLLEKQSLRNQFYRLVSFSASSKPIDELSAN
ncbi:MAG TPA: hypothetical protein P5299_01960 [Candidatus Woesebacteria bacterium]|nr:hypothetical protein [Candidatus Woesebacteria bacterium]